METEAGVEGNERKFEGGVAKSYSSLSSTKQLTDPVVYKLVRIEVDGRLVPATDDEVIEVEGLLLDEKNEMHIVADAGQAVGCISKEQPTGILLHLETSGGLLQSESTEANLDKFNARPEDTVPSLASSLSNSYVHQPGSFGECLIPRKELTEGGSLISAAATPSKPDFSKFKGEICLDNLSIKELHEMFRVTFGRETTVKDKQWLKRRITMGLTNSCDVSATSFTIKDNKLIKKGKDEGLDVAFINDGSVAMVKTDEVGTQINRGNHFEDYQVSDKRNLSMCDNSGSEDHHTEQRAAKRIRKPTKRYIEELSEVDPKESSGRIKTSVKDLGFGHLSSNYQDRPVKNITSDGRTIITRLDSLGGLGIRIPCVSRVRRSRPRKNFMALLKFKPSDVALSATLVKKALGAHGFLPDNENGKISSPSLGQDQYTGVQDKDRAVPTMSAVEVGHHKFPQQVDLSGDSDDNIVTVPTPKGGIRRKHHRAWTLPEVMKLVEGVSRYGAGRWSEIKRLAFASYSYRTSVDLKDKWRNLLKASFAHVPSDKGANSRKTAGTMPIPEQILLKVRELAEMQLQVPPNLSLSKVAQRTGNNVHEKQSGFL